MRSLQGRLLLGTAIASAVMLLAAGMVLYLLVRLALVAEFDAVLAAKARALGTLVEQDGDKVDFEAENVAMPEFERANRPEYFELWLEEGSVLARSKSLRGGHLSRIDGPPGVPVFQWTLLPDGRCGRLVGVTFTPRQENNDGEPGRPARPREAPGDVLRTARCPPSERVPPAAPTDAPRTARGPRAAHRGVDLRTTVDFTVRRGSRGVPVEAYRRERGAADDVPRGAAARRGAGMW